MGKKAPSPPQKQYAPVLGQYRGGEYRVRTTLERTKGSPGSWATQLEWYDPEEERFVWVVRYDTAGGTPHRDRNRVARHEPTDRDLKGAQEDLAENAAQYKVPGGQRPGRGGRGMTATRHNAKELEGVRHFGL
ncbi:MAG: DUF7718 family protein [Deinococcota bacterium]